MIKQNIIAFISLVMLLSSTISLAEESTPTDSYVQNTAPAAFPNFFDPSTWSGNAGTTHNHASAQHKMAFNPAHPSWWMKIADPKTHNMMHMQLANPATYAQMMQPQFWMQFMNPQNMMAWMDFNQYAVMMNPQTMAYWMNPTSYMHAFDPNMYAAAMNPASYMVYMNPATYMGWAGMQYPSTPLAAAE
ncbi:MAG: hypothetical protein AAGB35_04625 [Pseudomonadota bacterium]